MCLYLHHKVLGVCNQPHRHIDIIGFSYVYYVPMCLQLHHKVLGVCNQPHRHIDIIGFSYVYYVPMCLQLHYKLLRVFYQPHRHIENIDYFLYVICAYVFIFFYHTYQEFRTEIARSSTPVALCLRAALSNYHIATLPNYQIAFCLCAFCLSA
jgi:hypothetical protein